MLFRAEVATMAFVRLLFMPWQGDKPISIPVGGMKAHMHFILSVSHTALRGISLSLSGDISVLARRYLRLCPQISPPVAYHAPINSANGW